MRLCGHRCVQLLVLTSVLCVKAEQRGPKERHYYIAAVEIDWNYQGGNGFGQTYKKVVFREYEEGFRQAKAHPPWLGLMGPTLRAEAGETLVVTFRNLARGDYSLHPHGIAYGKQSEGAYYFDNTSQKEKRDDIVRPNREHVYHWEVTPEVSPQRDDPACLTHSYISHRNVVEDYNSGLIGALLVCKPNTLDASGQQIGIHHELVFLFGVFDEKESKNLPKNYAADDHVKYTINGYSQGTLPDVSVCAHAPVSLHLLGMSSEPEVFSVHMNGQVLQQDGHKVSSVGLISGSSVTAGMVAVHPGRWLLSSHTVKHMEAGLHGFVDVKKCDGFDAPKRTLTIDERRLSREWTYYIAAEEVVWDYAPDMPQHTDEDFKAQYLENSAVRIGKKYKKAVFTLYTNESFTEKSESQQRRNELGILGPVIRAQIRDVIKIVFKNLASRPYSIYPHGLTIEKSQEGVNYPARGNQLHGVQPGETHTYLWHVADQDEPLEADSRCLTRIYHSAVDTPRDIASGLIGPILICKSLSLNVHNVQLKADKEQHAVFSVFDENKSWYLQENIRTNCDPSRVNTADPDFYKSNVMHTINGYTFESGPVLGFCNGEVTTWHVSSVGSQDFIQTATFYGHPFELNQRTEDILSLYPMSGETIYMDMSNLGVWLVASLSTHETSKGLRIKFQDVECFRDHEYEYEEEVEDEEEVTNEWKVWKPVTLDEIEKENAEKIRREEEKEIEEAMVVDHDTEQYADMLGIRSLKNQSSDMELLDLSFLDDDVVDVPDYHSSGKTAKQHLNKTEALEINVNMTKNENTSEHFNISSDSNSTETTTPDSNTTDYSPPNNTHKTNDSFDLLRLYIVNLTSSSEFAIESSEEVLTRGDVFSYEVSQKGADAFPSDNGPDVAALKPHEAGGDRSVSGGGRGNALNGTRRRDSNSTTQHRLNFTMNATASDLRQKATHDSANLNSSDSVDNVTNHSRSFNTALDSAVFNSSDNRASLTNSSHTALKNATQLDAGRLLTSSALMKTEEHLGSVHEIVPDSNATTLQNTSIFVEDTFKDSDQKQDKVTNLKSAEFGTDSTTLSNRDSFGNDTSYSSTNVSSVQSTIANIPRSKASESTEGSNVTTAANVSVEAHGKSSSGLSYVVGSSEELGWSASEEVVIYLQEKTSEAIKTKTIKNPANNWTYDATHETVAMQVPDHIVKYISKPAPRKKPRKKVTLRQWPDKGQGMKTKKKKEYLPQARNGSPFSPRGFKPGMSPRGSRPIAPKLVSNDEDLINKPIVIGVPRPNFKDYELYLPGDDPDHLDLDEAQTLTDNEYEYVSFKDPYSSHENMNDFSFDNAHESHLKNVGNNNKMYFIAAEEVEWDYAGYGSRREDKSQTKSRETTFKKVVFREYMDSTFTKLNKRGEIEEHLGILGPLIKAEVGQNIMVVFKNNASRPFSLHPNGVSYTKRTEGLNYEDGSKYWHKFDNEVQPQKTFTYLWTVTAAAGPQEGESDCRTWAYYSGVNPERDIHSGLIGPLLVCREGTLNRSVTNTREFTLLFMTFDETRSWYNEENLEMIRRKTKRRSLSLTKENLQFHTINGIIFSLKGLRMYTHQLVRWHLINMGSPYDFHSVHFHGQTFIHRKTKSHKHAVYPLLPGGFATLEMKPSKPGLWQLETEISSIQQKGMQTLFLVLDNDCFHPLGLESGSVTDIQMTAKDSRGYWEPHLARLNNAGKYNAWSTDENSSWIQVDFQRPVVVSQIATQGAKQMFYSQYVTSYVISYSNDRWSWTMYKGDSKSFPKKFNGNQEAYETKVNTFFPPIVGRFFRLYPIHHYGKATVRMEYYGCELDGCSVPLGMESRQIEDHHITASSMASSWYGGPWRPSFARLNKQGTINAWQARMNDLKQWLQVELLQVKKITGIVTQGAKSLGKEQYVVSYSVQHSNDGLHWTDYTDHKAVTSKTFIGNTNNNDHVKNYIDPPIFSRFIRIIPKSWKNSITMRVELLGCDFE